MFSDFLLFPCVECVLAFYWRGGLGSSFAKSSLLLRNAVISSIRIENFDLHGVLWSQGTPEEGRWLYRSKICISVLEKESWLRNAAL